MTKQEKKEGKILLNILKDYHKHYTELPKVNRLHGRNCPEAVRKRQEEQKHYCAGAKFGLQLAIELVEVYLDGRLQRVLERMEYYGTTNE